MAATVKVPPSRSLSVPAAVLQPKNIVAVFVSMTMVVLVATKGLTHT